MTVSVTFEIDADGPAELQSLRGALAFNGYDALVVERGGQVILKSRRGNVPPRPDRDPDFLLVDGISVFVEPESIDYHSAECFARADLHQPTIDLVYPESGWVRADLLVYAIIPLMARFGYYGLHAGAVSDGDTGYLFLGDSGGGKSTSTVLAVGAGWDFVSDDFVYVKRGREGMLAFGLRDTVCLRDDAAIHFPEYVELAAERGDGYKYRVSSREAFGDRVRDVCTPDVIVIPEVARTDETTFEPVARAEVLAEALRQSGPFLADPRTVPHQTSMLRDLIQHCDCWRMRAGRDILKRPELLTKMLTGLS